MNILFISNAPYIPDLRAGMQVTTYYQAKLLIARGHRIRIAVRTDGDTPAHPDNVCGYPVYRSNRLAEAVAAAMQYDTPDVIVLLEPRKWVAEIADLIVGTPIVFYQHSVHAGIPALDRRLLTGTSVVVATSPDCANWLYRDHGIASVVVPPLFGIDRFAETERHGNSVLFVSLQKRKGVLTAMKIARARPEIPFIFIASWTTSETDSDRIREDLLKLPNVTVLPNQDDLGPVFARTKLLLMPSRTKEAWGRMASEAQASGIPVLASRRGQLPVTVGNGGLCVSRRAPLRRWLHAFDQIMNDEERYAVFSRAAKENVSTLLKAAPAAFSVFETALLAAAGEARPQVELQIKNAEQKQRPKVTLADVRTGVRLALGGAQAWILPERCWPATSRWTSRVGAAIAGKSHGKVAARISTSLNLPVVQTDLLVRELQGARHEVALQCLRDARPGGWRPGIEDNLDEIHSLRHEGQGCVLWVAHFVFATNVVKMAMHRRGFDVVHLSRPDHGFSSSQAGIRYLNPVRVRFEAKYLADRIVFERGNSTSAAERARAILQNGGFLSLTAGAWEGRRLSRADFLGGSLSLATGPVTFARRTSSLLLPIFGVRTGSSDFLVRTGSPIDVHSQTSEEEAATAGVADYLRQLAPWVLRYPAQWRGWSSMSDTTPRQDG